MFFKCPSWLCKKLVKAQELLLLFKKNCWNATITPNCIMSVPLWIFLSLLYDSHNNFYSLWTTFTCSNFWKQSLPPHISVWAKRVQNTVLELKDIYTHIYRRARKGQRTNKFGLITSNKFELIFSSRLEKADHFLHKRGKALFQPQINTNNIAPNVMSVQQFYSVMLRIIANRVSDFVN